MSFLVFPSLSTCNLIIREVALRKYPEFAANIISGCDIKDSGSAVLESAVVWDMIFNNKDDSSLEAYKVSEVPSMFSALVAENIVALKLSANRADNVCTIFVDAADGLQVIKISLASLLSGDAAELIRLAAKESVYAGVGLDILLYQKAHQQDWAGVFQCLQDFFDEVFSRFSVNHETLQATTIDMIPRNALLDMSGRINFFDIEYTDAGQVKKTFFIYRVCLSVMGRKGYLFAGCGYDSIYEVYDYFCKFFGFKSTVKLEVKREFEFQCKVNGPSKKKISFFWALKPFSVKKGFTARVEKSWRRARVKYFDF